MGTIFLLGDAVLDSHYWLTNKELDLRGELTRLGFSVKNYATEDARLQSMSRGIVPADKYRKSRSYPYDIDSEGKIHPLRLLVQNSKMGGSFTPVYGRINSSESGDMAVLSIGGNNIKDNVVKILLGVDRYIKSILTSEFVAEYESVIQQIKNNCDHMVLISIYLPYLGSGSSYGMYAAYAKPVMNKWHEFLEKIARKHNIPILDLSKTLDPQNRSHYGTVDIYPSNISNKCIADSIAYIHHHYDGFHIYSAPNCDIRNITVEDKYIY